VRRLWALLYIITLCSTLGGCFYFHTEDDDPPYRHYYGGYGGEYDPYGDDDWRRHEWASH
jgi:hypothetical protein